MKTLLTTAMLFLIVGCAHQREITTIPQGQYKITLPDCAEFSERHYPRLSVAYCGLADLEYLSPAEVGWSVSCNPLGDDAYLSLQPTNGGPVSVRVYFEGTNTHIRIEHGFGKTKSIDIDLEGNIKPNSEL